MIEVTIMLADIEEIIDLRHRILREGLPMEMARWEGDDDFFTRHFAVFVTDESGKSIGTPICCASFMRVAFEGEDAWQLRGMATAPGHRGQGVGKELLMFAEQYLRGLSGPNLLWCNAREKAIAFYERQRWRCVSDTFDIPGAGPHRKMIKRI